MDSLRDLLGIRRMNRVPNPRIIELCGVTEVYERIDERVPMVWPYGENGE